MVLPAHYLALRDSAGFLDRSDRGRLRLSGSDRRSYLQGLLTNDVAALATGTGCYAAMLTAQGRMIADMRVLELGDAILMDLPGHIAAAIRDRLEQFVFTEDVVVADVGALLAQIGVYGPRAPEALSGAFARLASTGEGAPASERLRSMRLFDNGRWDTGGAPAIVAASDDYGIDGFEVFLDSSAAAAFRAALEEAGATSVSEESADVHRIESGRPAFGKDMDEDTIPLEAGIEERAISQTKGCYVGQEIIIRVLHRGHGRVARRLVGLVLDGATPAPGARIRSGERDIGFITSSARSPSLERPIALAYVHRDFVEPGTVVSVAGTDTQVPAVVASFPLVPRQAEPARP
jgi:folate-binding protein YgfZ